MTSFTSSNARFSNFKSFSSIRRKPFSPSSVFFSWMNETRFRMASRTMPSFRRRRRRRLFEVSSSSSSISSISFGSGSFLPSTHRSAKKGSFSVKVFRVTLQTLNNGALLLPFGASHFPRKAKDTRRRRRRRRRFLFERRRRARCFCVRAFVF